MISVYVCFVVNRLTVTLYIAVRVFFYDYRHAALGNSCSKLGSFYIYGTKKNMAFPNSGSPALERKERV